MASGTMPRKAEGVFNDTRCWCIRCLALIIYSDHWPNEYALSCHSQCPIGKMTLYCIRHLTRLILIEISGIEAGETCDCCKANPDSDIACIEPQGCLVSDLVSFARLIPSKPTKLGKDELVSAEARAAKSTTT